MSHQGSYHSMHNSKGDSQKSGIEIIQETDWNAASMGSDSSENGQDNSSENVVSNLIF